MATAAMGDSSLNFGVLEMLKHANKWYLRRCEQLADLKSSMLTFNPALAPPAFPDSPLRDQDGSG